MDQEIISKEKMDYTIDLLITMAVEEIAEVTGEKPQEVIKDFLKSKTGKALYDASTNLWCNGPSYISDMYLEEKKAVGGRGHFLGQ